MVLILSRDPHLYSTRVLKQAFSEAGAEVRVLDVLQLEVKVGKGVYLDGKKLNPTLVIPRFSEQILIAGLAVLREWEREEVRILNSTQSLTIAHNQLATLQALAAESLPIPETAFCSQPASEDTLQSLLGSEQKVIKLLDSAQGKGVSLAPNTQTARSITSTLATLRASGITQAYYADAGGVDYRLIVFQGQVVKAIQRKARDGDFRANLHQGGSVTPYNPSSEDVSLAVKAAEVVGLEFTGVDLLPTAQGSLILELNASPGLEGVETGEEGCIARKLASTLWT